MLLDSEGHVRITDFGLGEWLSQVSWFPCEYTRGEHVADFGLGEWLTRSQQTFWCEYTVGGSRG